MSDHLSFDPGNGKCWCHRCGEQYIVEHNTRLQLAGEIIKAFGRAHKRCPETRTRFALAWKCDVSETAFADSCFIFYSGIYTCRWYPSGPHLCVSKKAEGEAEATTMFFPKGKNQPLNPVPAREFGIVRVARFFCFMGYDIEFLAEHLTMTSLQKIEWAMQMKDAHLPLEKI